MDDDQATLDVDVAVDAVPDDAGNSGGDPQPEPFLAVNERTKYATREDAVKAYDEAGKRISSLSNWEKTGTKWGVSDPKHLEPIFNELMTARKELPTLKAELEALKKAQAAIANPKPASNDPKAQEAEAVKKYLADLGYTSKEDVSNLIKELKDEISGLKNTGSQYETQRLENQTIEAREQLGTWLSEAQVTDDADGSKREAVEELIAAWINKDDDRVAQWQRGGSGAMKLAKEGFERVITQLGLKPAAAQPNASAAQAANVGRKLQNGKTLPAQGTARNASAQSQPVAKKGLTSALHNKAWDYMEKHKLNA